jgi:hypothetical protein
MEKRTLWTFSGFVTEGGRRTVQEWYDGLPGEEYEELQDVLNYLSVLENWKRPEFDKVQSPLHEIRSKANQANHCIRVYGVFDRKIRHRFIMLYGNEAKKVSKDKNGQRIALDRLSLLNQGRATTHEFVIESDSAQQSAAQQGISKEISGIQSKQRNRLPN